MQLRATIHVTKTIKKGETKPYTHKVEPYPKYVQP